VLTMVRITEIPSNLTGDRLEELCGRCHIPSFVHPVLPYPGQDINQPPPGKIGVGIYT
jgi:hypothetical protein